MTILDKAGLTYLWSKIKSAFVSSIGVDGNDLTYTKNGTTSNITIPYATQAGALAILQSKTYTNVIGTANNNPGAVFYFLSVKPTDWNFPCVVTYRISAKINGVASGTAVSILKGAFTRNTMTAYGVWNYIGNTNYRPYYYHYRYLATETGFNAGYGHLLGIGLNSSYNPTTAANSRTIDVEVLEISNGTFTLFDTMTKYASVPGTGSTNYSGETTLNATTQGDTHSGDANTTNILISAGYVGPVGPIGILSGSLFMQTGAGHWSPFTTNTSTSTASNKGKNTEGFRLESPILYFSGTNNAANAVNVNSTVYLSYSIDFRYSTNCGQTLVVHRPVYLVGTIGSDGLFYLDDTWWAQTLPSSDDGKLYIHLGQSYANYTIQLWPTHPIFYFKNGKIRQYLVAQETDPIFSASPAAGITSANITSWNNKQNALTIDSEISSASTNPIQNKAIQEYIVSRGENLVSNGFASFGNNYNFQGFNYDATDTDGAGGCFYKTNSGQGNDRANEYMPVDISKSYRLSYSVKNTSETNTYDFIDMYDIDKNQITSSFVDFVRGSTTTLTQDLKNGDTVIHLASVSGFSATGTRGLIFWNYVNSKGYQYPIESYSRNAWSSLWSSNIDSIDTTNNTITLSSPWDKGTFSAGVSLSQMNMGGTYVYGNVAFKPTPNTWVRMSYVFAPNKFRAGTAFIRIGWLYNYSSVANNRFSISSISFTQNASLSDLNGKQDTINDLDTIRSGASAGATAYQKPSGGIPKTDLASAVQTSLGKADTALQSFTETDPTVPSWAKQSSKPTYTAQEVGALPASTTIPTKTSDLTNDSGFLTSLPITLDIGTHTYNNH